MPHRCSEPASASGVDRTRDAAPEADGRIEFAVVGEPQAAVPSGELVVVSAWVLSGVEPIRMVVHHLEGDWSVVCGTVDDVAHLHGRRLTWLRGRRDVGRFVDGLLPGSMVTRDDLGDEWVREVAPVE